MRSLIDLIIENQELSEKIVYRNTVKNSGDFLDTIIAINPSKLEFWSANFRQGKDGLTDQPHAAGVIMKDGTIVVGEGHQLAHDDIVGYAGLDMRDEKYRLQIAKGQVIVEIWLDEEVADNSSSLEEKVQEAERMYGKTISEIKEEVSGITSRFVPGWVVICGLWTEYSLQTKV